MSTKDERLLAGQAVTIKAVLDYVRALEKQVRGQLEPLIDADGGIAAETRDGQRIGTAKRSKPRATVAVTDERALLAWVKANRPTEIEETVRPAFVDALKARARKHGLAVLDDGTVVPGIELVEGSSSYLPQPSQHARAVVHARLDELIGAAAPALPATSEPELEAS